MSFTGMDPQNQAKFSWVGISNYKMLISGQGMAGSIFWIIFAWTLVWTFVATSSAVFVGFTLSFTC
jgi:arabinogalactan oligomer / maltooligosaccharide transport system permease protein